MTKLQNTQPAQDNSQPVGTPPGGGSWTWSATQAAWIPVTPAAPAQQNTDAQE
jgi:hypothetical protein